MRVFISWSGERSRAAAVALRRYIGTALQTAEIVMADDFVVGGFDSAADSTRLMSVDTALICLTRDNLLNPWLTFEAGVHKGRAATVIPILLDISPADLSGPWAQFQSVTFSKDDMFRLLVQLNRRSHKPTSDAILSVVHNTLWTTLEQQLRAIPPMAAQDAVPLVTEGQTDRELLQELLENVRKLTREATETAKKRKNSK